MHKSATKCNETLGKWCKNKHGASKIIDTFETYHGSKVISTSGKGSVLEVDRQPDVVALSSIVAVDSQKKPVSSNLGLKDSLQQLSDSEGQEDLGIQIALSYDSGVLQKFSKSPSFDAAINLGSEDCKLLVFDQTCDPFGNSASNASKVSELPVCDQTPKTSMCIFGFLLLLFSLRYGFYIICFILCFYWIHSIFK
jgi:hypothetical protein